MIASAHYPIHHQLVELVYAKHQVGLESTCVSIAQSLAVPIVEVYRVLHELIELEVVQFIPKASIDGLQEPQAALRINEAGYELYYCLAEISTPTRTMNCGTTILFIARACGMATKRQMFRRLLFVKHPRRYSHNRIAVQLWALVQVGRMKTHHDACGIRHYAITREGRYTVSRMQKRLGYTGNISMGE